MTTIAATQKTQAPTLEQVARPAAAPQTTQTREAQALAALDRAQAAHAKSAGLKQLAFVETPLVAGAALAGRRAVIGRASFTVNKAGTKAWQNMTGMGPVWRYEAQLMPKTKGALIVAGAAAVGVGAGHLIRKAANDKDAVPVPAILGVIGGVAAIFVLKGKAGNVAFRSGANDIVARGIRLVHAPF